MTRPAREVMASNIGSRWWPPAKTSEERDQDWQERLAAADSILAALIEAGYVVAGRTAGSAERDAGSAESKGDSSATPVVPA